MSKEIYGSSNEKKISNYTNVNKLWSKIEAIKDFVTPIIFAYRNKMYNIVNLLIVSGSNTSNTYNYIHVPHKTPLQFACEHKMIKTDLKIATDTNRIALQCACLTLNNYDMIKLLLNHNIYCKKYDGFIFESVVKYQTFDTIWPDILD